MQDYLMPIMTLYYVFVGLFGLIIGSFLNVCIYRIPKGISVAKGFSFCPVCNSGIKWYQNIPVLSYLVLRGKCAYCKGKISKRYPIIELLCGVCFLAVAFKYGISVYTLIYCAFSACLIAVAFIDIDTGEIPNRFSIIILALGIIAACTFYTASIADRLIGAGCISIPLLIIALITKGFGGGDIKLMAASGFLLGAKLTILAAFIAITAGAIWGIILLATKKKGKKDKMIFGQFLAMGTFSAIILGEEPVNMYLKFLGI